MSLNSVASRKTAYLQKQRVPKAGISIFLCSLRSRFDSDLGLVGCCVFAKKMPKAGISIFLCSLRSRFDSDLGLAACCVFAKTKSAQGRNLDISLFAPLTARFRPWARGLLFRLIKEECPRPESNQRHADFQSAALPTELPGHSGKKLPGMVTTGGRE